MNEIRTCRNCNDNRIENKIIQFEIIDFSRKRVPILQVQA